jgi:inhibitor of KinA sporulation pathway (predicted exonuclease)
MLGATLERAVGSRKLLIVDLEATCWERALHDPERMETIEIGALEIDPGPPLARREFQCFVRPVLTPLLSSFCTSLTKICQADVDAAPTFAPAFARFVAWIGDLGAVRLASWGRYDQRQLERDCALHAVRYPFLADHLDLKPLCCAAVGLKRAGMATALARASLALDGTHHRALDDARNIARLAEIACAGEWSVWLPPLPT